MNVSPRKIIGLFGLNVILAGLNSCTSVNSQSGSHPGAPLYAYEGSARSVAKSASSSDAMDRSLEERPGLATHAGSEVYSSVQDTAFYRKSAGVPDAVDSFH